MIELSNKQKEKIETIIHNKIRLLQHHFSRLMLKMVNEITDIINSKL